MPRDTSGDDPFALGEAKALGETEKALKVLLDGADEEMWVPKSCVHDDSEVWKKGDEGKLVVKTWFAEKNALSHA